MTKIRTSVVSGANTASSSNSHAIGNSRQERAVWELSLIMREIAQNPGEEADTGSSEANISSEIKGGKEGQ